MKVKKSDGTPRLHAYQSPNASLHRILVIGVVAFPRNEEGGAGRRVDEVEMENATRLLREAAGFQARELRGMAEVRCLVLPDAFACDAFENGEEGFFGGAMAQTRSLVCSVGGGGVDEGGGGWRPTYVCVTLLARWGLCRLPEDEAGRLEELRRFAVARGFEAMGKELSMPLVNYCGGSRACRGGFLDSEEAQSVSRLGGMAWSVWGGREGGGGGRVGWGFGIVTEEAWMYAEIPTCSAVAFHEALGHGIGLPHPYSHGKNCVMGQGIYVPSPLPTLSTPHHHPGAELHTSYALIADIISPPPSSLSFAQSRCPHCRQEFLHFHSRLHAPPFLAYCFENNTKAFCRREGGVWEERRVGGGGVVGKVEFLFEEEEVGGGGEGEVGGGERYCLVDRSRGVRIVLDGERAMLNERPWRSDGVWKRIDPTSPPSYPIPSPCVMWKFCDGAFVLTSTPHPSSESSFLWLEVDGVGGDWGGVVVKYVFVGGDGGGEGVVLKDASRGMEIRIHGTNSTIQCGGGEEVEWHKGEWVEGIEGGVVEGSRLWCDISETKPPIPPFEEKEKREGIPLWEGEGGGGGEGGEGGGGREEREKGGGGEENGGGGCCVMQ